MKTDDLVKALAADLRPQAPTPSLGAFLVKWIFGILIFLISAISILPRRGDWEVRVHEPRFLLETSLWLLAGLVGGVIVYRSAIPSMLKRGEQLWALLPLALVATLWAARVHSGGLSLGTEFHGELDIWRGQCGPLIGLMGMIVAGGLFIWARQAAPTRLRTTGLWAAISAGCLGSFAMQFVCAHDNGLHLWIWHVGPIMLLVITGTCLGQRWLRWGGSPVR